MVRQAPPTGPRPGAWTPAVPARGAGCPPGARPPPQRAGRRLGSRVGTAGWRAGATADAGRDRGAARLSVSVSSSRALLPERPAPLRGRGRARDVEGPVDPGRPALVPCQVRGDRKSVV